jgi:hypothetical protein
MGNRLKLAMPSSGGILVLIFLFVFLVNSMFGQDAASPGEHVFDLKYKPDGFGLNVGFGVLGRDKFEKEPDFGGRSVVRGTLGVGAEEKDHIGFVLDSDERKLYIDLNRNGDLSDDPGGIFETNDSGSWLNFQNIPVKLQTGSFRLPYIVNIGFYLYDQGIPHGFMRIVSGFQAEIEVNGKKWLLQVADDMDGKITRNDKIVLVPVEAKIGLAYEQLSLPVPETVFFDGRNYGVSFEFKPGETDPSLQVRFVEADCPMGQLKLEGKFVKRLVFEADSALVLLDSPEGVVPVPAGKYRFGDILLDGGEAGLFKMDRYARQADALSVIEGETAALKVGGPLNNSVGVTRQGNVLTLQYKLSGIDGYSYESMRGRATDAPTFVVYNNGKEVASGKFEYG